MPNPWNKRGFVLALAVGLAVWIAALAGAVDFGRTVIFW
jgi:hypothetical protein